MYDQNSVQLWFAHTLFDNIKYTESILLAQLVLFGLSISLIQLSTLLIQLAQLFRIPPIFPQFKIYQIIFLKVASSDPYYFVNIYDSKWSKINTFKGLNDCIYSIDFDSQEQYVKLITSNNDVIYYDYKINKRKVDGNKETKDFTWQTWTSPVGWPVQGIYPPCSSNHDINSVDLNFKKDLLVTGDDFGKLKLFKYPSYLPNSGFRKFIGHSDQVTKCGFAFRDRYIVSIGGKDKTIIQWSLEINEQAKDEAHNISQNIQHHLEHNEEQLMFQSSNQEFYDTQENKPYKTEITQMVPNNPIFNNDYTTGNINLKYVHGYKCNQTYKNCVYAHNKSVVYTTASLAIISVESSNGRQQSYFCQHNQEINALALHPNKKYVATGGLTRLNENKYAQIFIWDIDTKDVLNCLQDFHLKGIQQLAFSPNGKLLVSIGMDSQNSLAVHNWQSGIILCNVNVELFQVNAIVWKDSTQFMTCGETHVQFYKINGRNIDVQRGLLGQGKPFNPMLSAAYIQNQNQSLSICVTGDSKGNLFVWQDLLCQRMKEHAHDKAVGVLINSQANSNQIISGGDDGVVAIWEVKDAQLIKKSTIFDKNSLKEPRDSGIRSLDQDSDNNYLVSNKDSEIYIVQLNGQANRIENSHGLQYSQVESKRKFQTMNTWAIACSPDKYKFATAGSDHVVRMWDAETSFQEYSSVVFEHEIRALDWSQNTNDSFIVAGAIDGTVYLLDSKDLSVKSKTQSSQNQSKYPWIQDIKFSPNGKFIAYGTHGEKPVVEILTIEENNQLKPKSGNSIITTQFAAGVTNLDWSYDSGVLFITSAAYEIISASITTMKKSLISGVKEVPWQTWTSTLGWPVQGITQDKNEHLVTACCRNQNSNKQKILAVGNKNGQIKLYRYPCADKKALFKTYEGHSQSVRRIRFTFDDRYLISVGDDNSILIWRTDFQFGNQKEGEQDVVTSVYQGTLKDDDLIKIKQTKLGTAKYPNKMQSGEKDKLDEIDQFLNLQPWVGSCKEPRGFIKPALNSEKAPNFDLQIDYVYGYRAKDVRNNVYYNKFNNICYFVAAIGIVQANPSQESFVTPKQQFYLHHKSDITTIKMMSDKTTIATGDSGTQSEIHVWNSLNLQTIKTFKVLFKQQMLTYFQNSLTMGISALAFSEGGKTLAAACLDEFHTIAIYDLSTKQGQEISQARGGSTPINDLVFKSQNQFVSVGVQHFTEWQLDGRNLQQQLGNFGLNDGAILCAEINDQDIVCGTQDGYVQVWRDRKIKHNYKIHEAAVHAINISDNQIITGSKDQTICVLDKTNYTKITNIEVAHEIGESKTQNASIRSIATTKENQFLLLCTEGSEIFQLQIKDRKFTTTTKFYGGTQIVNLGHSQFQSNAETWGLACNPIVADQFATVSDDATLRIWSISKKTCQIKKTNIDNLLKEIPIDPNTMQHKPQSKGRCVCYRDDGNHVAVGFLDGHVKVYDTNDLNQIACFKPAKDWILDIKYSPDSKYLAIASADCGIFIWQVADNYAKIKWTLRKHFSYVTHIDWSLDSKYLHSNCGSYELLYWDIDSGKEFVKGTTSLRDEKWETINTTMCWHTQGIQPIQPDGNDQICCDRTHNPTSQGYHLLAVGDDFSNVKVYRFPVIKKNSQYLSANGHSSNITNVKWNANDEYLLSIGRQDNCIIQWKVNKQL